MKIITFLLFAFLIIGCKSDTKNDLEEMNLKGKIKSTKEVFFKGNEEFGEYVNGDWEYTYEYFFNKQGNLTEINSYYPPTGSIHNKTKYLYDSNNQLIEEYLYDFKGELDSFYQYYYDKEGNVLKKVEFDENNDILFTEKYFYDKNNLLKEIKIISQDGSLYSQEKYKYDKDGKLYEKIGSEVSKFNKKGQLIEEYHYPTLTFRFIYDDNGEQIKKTFFRGEDDPGSGDNVITKIEYDDNGNWIRKIEIFSFFYEEFSRINIIEREIEYY